MTDRSLRLDQVETSESAQAATDLVNNPNALGRVILSKMDTPPPLLKDCVYVFNVPVFKKNATDDEVKKNYYEVKKKYYKDLIQAFVKKGVGAQEASKIAGKHADRQDLMAEMLVQADDLCDFKRKSMHILAQAPQSIYLEKKKKLEAKIGAHALAHLMNVLMKASSNEQEGEKAFGLLFYAEAYGNNQFQDIADIANATRLTSYKSSGNLDNPMPKEIDLHENLFGKNPTRFISIPLASKVGHILVPKDPTQSDTVYLVYEGKAQDYEFLPMPYFPKTHEDGNTDTQVKKYISARKEAGEKDKIYFYKNEAGVDWCAGVNVEGEIYMKPLPEDLKTQMSSVDEQWLDVTKKKELNKPDFKEKFLKIAEQKQWVRPDITQQDLLQLSQEIAKIQHEQNAQNVNWKPTLKVMKNTLDPELDKIPVVLPSFFSNFPNELSKGLGLITKLIKLSRRLGLTQIVEAQERKLHRYARYLAIRPVLQFLAEQVIPIASQMATGAFAGSLIPIPGISTAVGALIGLGIGVAQSIHKGYETYHYHKALKAEAAKRGIEVTVKSYSKFKAEADSALDSVLASPNPTLLLSQISPEPKPESKSANENKKVPPPLPPKLPKPTG